MLDDHVLHLLAKRGGSALPGLHPNPLFLFSFTSGKVADNRAMMDEGALLPWFTDPEHKNAFFRPLSSLTHVLDFSLFPEQPWLMHLHSLAWLGFLLSVAFHVYRALFAESPPLARLSFALFALDGSHAMTAGWIANRNALCATVLALPALLAYHRAATRGALRSALLGPLCFALGLCAGETAVAVLAYLVAYALVLDESPWPKRFARLLPYLALLALQRVAVERLGFGTHGSGVYHDPGHEPLAYAFGLVQHLPVLLFSQLVAPVADLWFWGRPELHLSLWIASAVTLALLALAAHVLLADDRTARFWALGMVLSACAVAASVPGQRLLLVPGIGGAALGAQLIAKLREQLGAARAAESPARRDWRPILLEGFFFLHVIQSPLSGPVGPLAFAMLGRASARADAAIPRDEAIAERSVIVVNPPFDVLLSYIQLARAANDTPRPAHLYWLASASSELTLETLDAERVRVSPARGFLYTPLERHYRGDPRGLGLGTEVALSEMSVRIIALTSDRRPAAAEFRFRDGLRSPRYLLRYFDAQRRLRVFAPPAPGERVRFAQQSFFQTLLAEAFGGMRNAEPP